MTNKDADAGTVTVTNDQTSLYVTYSSNPNFNLTATHLAVTNSLADIPKTNKGKPVPGEFPYQTKHNKVASFSYTVPLGGFNSTIYVGAHADVVPSNMNKSEDAWAEGTLFNIKQRSWGMYFIYATQPCNQPPVSMDDTATVVEDSGATPINVLANDSDPDADPFTIASASDPAHGTAVVAGDGLSLTYQPDANYCNDGSPTDDFTYSLNPGGAMATVAVTVTCVNDDPVAVDDAISVPESSAATAIQVLANDADVEGDAFSLASASDPDHGTVGVAGDGLSFTFEPDASYCNDSSPTDDFTYALTPGGSTATVAVTVTCVDEAPTAVDDTATLYEDSGANTIDVLANDPDPDAGPKSIDSVTQPANGAIAITNSGAEVTYTPNANHCNDGATTDDFTYTLAPGGSTASVAVTVTCVVDPPIAINDGATVDEDSGATAIDVLENDTNPDGGPKSVALVTQPANGTVAITGGGTGVTYEPDANYCYDGSPTEEFTYTVTPGGSTATVAVTVTCVDDLPSAVNDAATVTEDDGATSINVLANDSDVDGGPAFSISSVTQPDHGAVVIANGGADLTYQPNADHCNGGSPTDDFIYTLTPGGSTAAVSVTVTCVNDAPVNTVPGAQSVNEDTDLTFSSGDGNALTVADIDAGGGDVQVTVSVVNGTITPATGYGAAISGSGTSSATMTGTPTQVNAALNGLKYRGNANYNSTRGAGTLTLVTSDQGNTGTGGAKSDTDTVAITVNAVNDAPVAQAQNYGANSIETNMKRSLPAESGLLVGASDLDTGDSGYAAAFTVGSINGAAPVGATINTTIAGVGTVSANAGTGAFDFDPAPGVTGDVSFNYTICDSGSPAPSACSTTATVTFNISGPVIWFVNAAAAGPGAGTLADPFKTLASADGVDSANHRIFLYQGTYVNGITLNSGEWLVGPAVTGFASFDALMGITPPTGTLARPLLGAGIARIQGTLTLASNANVKGITISTTGATQGLVGSGGLTGVDVSQSSIVTVAGTALSLNDVGGTLTFLNLTTNGSAIGVDLTNVGATVSIGSGTIQNTTSAGVSINGGNGNFSQSFSSLSNSIGRTILVQNRTGGTVSFAGTINGGGTGVLLDNNPGSTVNFGGGLALHLSTGSNAAFTATGGGTVSVAGNNTLSTTTRTALRVENTTIGASGLTFRSISADGAANGIVLNNTGTIGGLTVTGTGATNLGGDSSGGTISSMVGADGTTAGIGVYLNNTRNVTLRRMTINGANQNFGIRGFNVTGFTLEYSTVSGTNGTNSAAGTEESSISFDGLFGSAAITSSIVEGGATANLRVLNTSGTLNRLTVTGSSFGLNSSTLGNNNVQIEAQNTATLNFTLQSSTIEGARADWLTINSNNTSVMDVVIGGAGLGNTFDNTGANVNSGAVAGGNRLYMDINGTMTYKIQNNTFKGAKGSAIFVRSTGQISPALEGTARGRITGNVIGIAATANSGSSEDSGISVMSESGGDHIALMDSNQVFQYNNHGILAQAGDSALGGSTARPVNFEVTVTNNTVSTPGNLNSDFNGIHLNNGTSDGTNPPASADQFTSCVDVRSNTILGAGQGTTSPDNLDFQLRQRINTTVRLPGYLGANNNDAAVVTFIQGQNNTGGTPSGAASTMVGSGGGGFTGGSACTQP